MTTDPGIQILLPRRIQDLLNSCPMAGSGVHRWLFKAAINLHPFFTNKDEIADLLLKYSRNCNRDIDERELWGAIDDSERRLAQEKAQWLKRQCVDDSEKRLAQENGQWVPKWPDVNRDLIKSIVETGPTLDGLFAKSPIRLTDQEPHAEEIMAMLFPKDSLICVAQTQEFFRTGSLQRWIRFYLLRLMPFLVPSPMSAVYGLTKNGKKSMHTLENTGPRRFLVIEFDQGTTDEHAALLWHLGQREPLAMVVHSGGKSLHGWFFCQGRDETELLQFMRYAVGLGADPATWVKSQLVRMPNGWRDNGKRQRVFYFNPNLLINQ